MCLFLRWPFGHSMISSQYDKATYISQIIQISCLGVEFFFKCNNSKWNFGQISSHIWSFQILNIQSWLFIMKMIQLNKNPLFWNIYDMFWRSNIDPNVAFPSASSPNQHPWLTVACSTKPTQISFKIGPSNIFWSNKLQFQIWALL